MQLLAFIRYKTLPTLLRQKKSVVGQILVPIIICALVVSVFAPQIPDSDYTKNLKPITATDAPLAFPDATSNDGKMKLTRDPQIFYVIDENSFSSQQNSNSNTNISAVLNEAVDDFLLNKIYRGNQNVTRSHSKKFATVSDMNKAFFVTGQLNCQADISFTLSQNVTSSPSGENNNVNNQQTNNNTITYSIQHSGLPQDFSDLSQHPNTVITVNPFVQSMDTQLVKQGVITFQTWLLDTLVKHLRSFEISPLTPIFINESTANKTIMKKYETTYQPYPLEFGDQTKAMQYMVARGSITITLAPIFMVVAIVQVFLRSGTNFVSDKEYYLRQQLVLNGMSKFAYVLAVVFENLFIFSLSSLAVLGMLCGVGVFFSTPFGICFFLFLVAIVNLTMQAFVSQTFFTNARFAPLLLFLTYVGQIVLGAVVAQCTNSSCTPELQAFVAFTAPPANFLLTMNSVLKMENNHGGSQWSNFFTLPAANNDDNHNAYVAKSIGDASVGAFVLMAAASTVVNFFFACYLEEIIPGISGVARPFYYPILPLLRLCFPSLREKSSADFAALSSSSRKNTAADDTPLLSEKNNNNDNNSASSSSSPRKYKDGELALRARGLRKEYGDFVAVENLDIDLRIGECVSLVGKNASGKSSTFGMLTGLSDATAGEIEYFGSSLNSDPARARSCFSVCFQHNVLIPLLTAREHLLLFGSLKGIPNSELDEEVQQAINDLHLGEKADAPATSFSGGQKRRLSLLAALIGKTPIVYIDEGTAGVDVVSRQEIHDLLRKNMPGRAIIMSTHFLDEAVELSTSITIIDHGKLVARGSALELTTQLGGGYSLTVTGVDSSQHQSISDRIIKLCNGEAKFVRSVGGELVINIPFSCNDTTLVPLLRDLENDAELGSKFRLEMCTLEDVFMKLTDTEKMDAEESKLNLLQQQQDDDDSTNAAAASSSSSSPSRNNNNNTENSPIQVVDEALLTTPVERNCFLYFKQFFALLYKRACVTRRDHTSFAFQIFFPILFLIVGIVVYNSLMKDVASTSASESLWFVVGNNHSSSDVHSHQQHIAVNPSNITSSSDRQNIALLATNEGKVDCCYSSATAALSPGTTTTTSSIAVWDFKYWQQQSQNNQTSINTTIDFYFNASHRGSLLYEVNSFAIGGLNLGKNLSDSSSSSSANDENFITSFTGLIRELPQNPATKKVTAQLILILALSLSFSFVPASYAAFVVREREINSLFLQLVSGTPRLLYWFSSCFWDSFLSLVFAGIVLLALKVGAPDVLGDNDKHYVLFFSALFAYILCATLLTYSWSLLYDRYAKAQVSIALTLWSFTFVLTIGFISTAGSTGPASNPAQIVGLVFSCINPLWCLMHILMIFVDTFGVGSASLQKCGPGSTIDSFCVSGKYVWILWLQTAGCAGLLVLHQLPYESWIRAFRYYCCCASDFSTGEAIPIDDEEGDGKSAAELSASASASSPLRFIKQDEDVTAEKKRAHALLSAGRNTNNTGDSDLQEKRPALIIDNIHKLFGSFHAVRGVSFTVSPGEICCLLGANGASKTTTVRCSTGETVPSAGRVELSGVNVLANPSDAQSKIGLCPQFDALHPEQTCRETLMFYAMLKGIPMSKCSDVVDAFLIHCGLEEYRDRQSGNLSGGNRRRLSLAVSVLGAPDVLLIDEASSGACPTTRRKTWAVISAAAKIAKSAVVLVTHHLEEAEALADRTVIMSRGKIRCIGTNHHLKTKFSQGYRLQLTCAQHPYTLAPQVSDWILNTFAGSSEIERNLHRMKFSLPNSLKLSQIFENILAKKATDPEWIVDFGVANTTLEQVFFQIVAADEMPRHSLEEDENNNNNGEGGDQNANIYNANANIASSSSSAAASSSSPPQISTSATGIESDYKQVSEVQSVEVQSVEPTSENKNV